MALFSFFLPCVSIAVVTNNLMLVLTYLDQIRRFFCPRIQLMSTLNPKFYFFLNKSQVLLFFLSYVTLLCHAAAHCTYRWVNILHIYILSWELYAAWDVAARDRISTSCKISFFFLSFFFMVLDFIQLWTAEDFNDFHSKCNMISQITTNALTLIL